MNFHVLMSFVRIFDQFVAMNQARSQGLSPQIPPPSTKKILQFPRVFEEKNSKNFLV